MLRFLYFKIEWYVNVAGSQAMSAEPKFSIYLLHERDNEIFLCVLSIFINLKLLKREMLCHQG